MTVTLDYTVDELVTRVRRTLQLRSVNLKLTTIEVMQVCDEEIQQNLFPSLMRVREDYQSTYSTVLLTAGVGSYRLPQTAASATIDHIDLTAIRGGLVTSSTRLARLEVPSVSGFVGTTNATPVAYVLQGDTIRLLPTPDVGSGLDGFALTVTHEAKPGRLTSTAVCSQVASVAVNGFDLTVTLTAPLSSSLAVGDFVDFVPNVPPLSVVLSGVAISDTTNDPIIVVSSGYSIPSTTAATLITAGAYIVPTGYTCSFPLPDMWWSVAVLACSASVARVTGNAEQSAMLRAEADAAIARAIAFQSNRVRKQPHAVFDRNSYHRRGIAYTRRS